MPVLPAFELISTVASGVAGAERPLQPPPAAVGDRPLPEGRARKAKALLILDIQPGHIDWMTDVVALRPYLEQPDVSLALDPEWKVPEGQIPGKVIGSTDAADVNRVSAYLAAIVRARKLPQKLLVVHQFTDDMIRRKELLVQPPGVALTLNVDGFGDQPNKVSKYVGFTHGARGAPLPSRLQALLPRGHEPDDAAPGAAAAAAARVRRLRVAGYLTVSVPCMPAWRWPGTEQKYV